MSKLAHVVVTYCRRSRKQVGTLSSQSLERPLRLRMAASTKLWSNTALCVSQPSSSAAGIVLTAAGEPCSTQSKLLDRDGKPVCCTGIEFPDKSERTRAVTLTRDNVSWFEEEVTRFRQVDARLAGQHKLPGLRDREIEEVMQIQSSTVVCGRNELLYDRMQKFVGAHVITAAAEEEVISYFPARLASSRLRNAGAIAIAGARSHRYES